MNLFYGVGIVLAVIMVILFFAANSGKDGLDKEAVKGFTVLIGVCTVALIVLISFGDAEEYGKQLDAQEARYENAMIDGTFKIGHNWEFEILNGDTTMVSDEPFVILLEN